MSTRGEAGGPIVVRRYGGPGPVVALLHGGPGAPGGMAGLARDLAPGFTVLEPLQRRSGGAPLTVTRHVADLAEILPPGAALVGWSWGAMLALSFATAHPGRARSLALVGCGTYDEGSRAELEAALAGRLGEEGRRRVEELSLALESAAPPEERDRALGRLGRLIGAAQACDALPDDEAEAPGVDARGHKETWEDVLRLQAEGVEPQSFRAITCPVLMLHGDDDPHPGPAIRDSLARHIPHLDYRGFPRCGHQPWAERHAREPFLAVLRDWLRDARGGAVDSAGPCESAAGRAFVVSDESPRRGTHHGEVAVPRRDGQHLREVERQAPEGGGGDFPELPEPDGR